MIIVPNAYVLSQSATARPLTHPRIGYQTYTRNLSASAVTASSTDAAAAADAPLRPDTYEYWQPTALPATWTVDLGLAYDIDYIGIAGHTIGTSGASVQVHYSTDNATWVAFADAAAPGDDAPLMFMNDAVFARYWRITLTGTVIPRLAVVHVGAALAMERSIYSGVTPPNLARETVLKNAMSRGGQFLGQNYRRLGIKTSVSFRNLTPTFVRDELDPFIRNVRRYPYFFAWRPSTYPNEIAYAWTAEDINPSNMGTGRLMQAGWSLRGIGYTD